MFRNWMNSCLCTLPDPSAMLLESETCPAQLLRIAVKPPRIQAVRNSMEFDREIGCSIPDFKILKAPVRPPRLRAACFFALSSLLFAVIFRVVPHVSVVLWSVISGRRQCAAAPLRSPASSAQFRRADFSSPFARE
jgi:hypothetical protein